MRMLPEYFTIELLVPGHLGFICREVIYGRFSDDERARMNHEPAVGRSRSGAGAGNDGYRCRHDSACRVHRPISRGHQVRSGQHDVQITSA